MKPPEFTLAVRRLSGMHTLPILPIVRYGVRWAADAAIRARYGSNTRAFASVLSRPNTVRVVAPVKAQLEESCDRR